MRNNVKKLSVRVTEDEYQHLKALSAASGLKIEPTIRKLILGAELRPRPPDAYADLLRELSATASSSISGRQINRGTANRIAPEKSTKPTAPTPPGKQRPTPFAA